MEIRERMSTFMTTAYAADICRSKSATGLGESWKARSRSRSPSEYGFFVLTRPILSHIWTLREQPGDSGRLAQIPWVIRP